LLPLSQESNYGIEKPGFKSVAYLTGHQIGGATHKWSYMFSASNTSTELDVNVNVSLIKELLMTFDPNNVALSFFIKKLIKLTTSIDSNVPLENLSSSRIPPLSTIILSPLENLTT
jgi:methionine aminopeptidase